MSYGDDGKIIVEVTEKQNFDLIVIGSRGMGAAKELFLGYFLDGMNCNPEENLT